jgi:hypothetical protein
MEVVRDQLGILAVSEQNNDFILSIAEELVNIEEYSKFKFGDGEVSAKYGSLLGGLVLGHEAEILEEDRVFVTSAAFRYAPPAAASLVGPFIQSAKTIARSVGSETEFIPFKVSKRKLATENYAALSFEERSCTVQSDLILPDNIEFQNTNLIVLDDIRVTGLREVALKDIFSNVGAAQANFFYILNTQEGCKFPQAEALINASAVKSIDDIIALANNTEFIPNVRMCKFIAAQTLDELERFCSLVPASVVDTITGYIEIENLRDVIKHTP